MIRNRVYLFISVPVFLLLYSYTAIAVFIILVFSFMKWKGGVYFIMAAWAKTLFPLMGKRLHIHGKENLDKHKKYILLANHASMFDITAIMAFYPGVSWFGHERLLRIPLFGKMLLLTDYIPMTLANIKNTRIMLEQLVDKAQRNTVAIFPEGTRTLNGKLSPFYRGFIYLLKATGYDILPVTLNGFFELKPKNRFHINFNARLEVIIHDPIQSEELIHLEDKKIIEKVRTVIESAAREPSYVPLHD